jgi:hypothetical protein
MQLGTIERPHPDLIRYVSYILVQSPAHLFNLSQIVGTPEEYENISKGLMDHLQYHIVGRIIGEVYGPLETLLASDWHTLPSVFVSPVSCEHIISLMI